jgi:flagellar hook-basal body complex protein FliE
MIGPLGGINPGFSLGQPGAAAATPAAAAAGPSFASVLSDVASKTVDTLKGAEQLSVQAIQGEADMRQVAEAVMTAEQSLTAAVAIRDKIVAAYMEISRMQT